MITGWTDSPPPWDLVFVDEAAGDRQEIWCEDRVVGDVRWSGRRATLVLGTRSWEVALPRRARLQVRCRDRGSSRTARFRAYGIGSPHGTLVGGDGRKYLLGPRVDAAGDLHHWVLSDSLGSAPLIEAGTEPDAPSRVLLRVTASDHAIVEAVPITAMAFIAFTRLVRSGRPPSRRER